MPEDETIFAFGGNVSGSSVSDATVIAVHVGRRQIARTDLGTVPAIREMNQLTVTRTSAGFYRMEGLNQDFVIRTSF